MLDRRCDVQNCPWINEGGSFCRYCGAGPSPEISAALSVNVINLDRSKDRLSEFAEVNAHLGSVQRIAAVDGRTLDQASLVASGVIASGLVAPDYYSVGALGAAMSHLSVFDRAIERNQPVTACEDDAIFNSHFARRAALILADMPADWDFILWGFNWDLFATFEMAPGASLCTAQFQQDRLRQSVSAFQAKQAVMPQAYPLHWAFGLTCYSISPKGARKLKARLLPLTPKLLTCPEAARTPLRTSTFRTVGIDNHLNEFYPQTKSFVCFPPLVATKNEPAKSTIQAR